MLHMYTDHNSLMTIEQVMNTTEGTGRCHIRSEGSPNMWTHTRWILGAIL